MALHVGDEEQEALKCKIKDAFSVFDREGRNACDVREVRAGCPGPGLSRARCCLNTLLARSRARHPLSRARARARRPVI